MSQFSRRARWLDFLFPQSVAPRTPQPGRVSDDISLTQPYDGGGYGGISNVDPLVFIIPPTQASADDVIITVGPDQIYRFLGCDVGELAGPAATGGFAIQGLPPNTGRMTCTPNFETVNLIPGGTERALEVFTPILGPNIELRFEYAGGGSTTRYIARVFGYLVPVGTVFYT